MTETFWDRALSGIKKKPPIFYIFVFFMACSIISGFWLEQSMRAEDLVKCVYWGVSTIISTLSAVAVLIIAHQYKRFRQTKRQIEAMENFHNAQLSNLTQKVATLKDVAETAQWIQERMKSKPKT